MKNTGIKLEVLICTMGPQGLERIARNALPAVPGVQYLISCQTPGSLPVPDALQRIDIQTFYTPTTGLCINRNHALSHATAGVVLIADDDEVLYPEGLKGVMDTFAANPELDFATFRYRGSEKAYPAEGFDLRRPPRGYFVSSIEIAFRLELYRRGLRFDERFGLGAPLWTSGEEEMLLDDALALGAQCRYYALTVASHEHASTGSTDLKPGTLRACGAVMRRREGLLKGTVKWPVRAWRIGRRTHTPFLRCLRFMGAGWLSYRR